MKLIEVRTKEQNKKFLNLPIQLYKNVNAWIRPLDKDVEGVFDQEKNKNFEHGECIRWILEDNGKVIGRIAAFINTKTANKDNDQPTGGMGFFECIDNQDAANLMLDACKNWLQERGMQAMDGPINFGDRDKWWGLLTKGYDLEPIYQCNYNLPYYKELIENYGFQIYFEHYTFIRNTFDPFHPRIKHKADLLNQDKDYHFEHLDKKRFEQHMKDIVTVYNKAWTNHEGVAKISKEDAQMIINQLKPIIDEKIIWLAYYKDEPVAFYINIPEVNQIIKYFNGKLGTIEKLKFLWHKWRRTNKKMQGLIFGVAPEHQGKGLDGALIMATAQMVQKDYRRYPTLEINGIGDFNRKMILVVKQVGGEIGKVHSTYRYLFDREKPFERMKPIG
ncbi:hypothetical protein [Chondrinema litorale]|uniref:hypothetical protein n=1 Tax=Chondrinema litorale TaxID=2994555 RepID=UPI00254287A1|nr:hypothetical protein [Chondrinema litorale]UZR98813.1 hypothetical protein OQ292_33740 [Chondrinema litorale]